MDLTGSAEKQKLKTNLSKWSTAKCSSLFKNPTCHPEQKSLIVSGQ
jgi:hypothetical protein